jgi:hypothetical protein
MAVTAVSSTAAPVNALVKPVPAVLRGMNSLSNPLIKNVYKFLGQVDAHATSSVSKGLHVLSHKEILEKIKRLHELDRVSYRQLVHSAYLRAAFEAAYPEPSTRLALNLRKDDVKSVESIKFINRKSVNGVATGFEHWRCKQTSFVFEVEEERGACHWNCEIHWVRVTERGPELIYEGKAVHNYDVQSASLIGCEYINFKWLNRLVNIRGLNLSESNLDGFNQLQLPLLDDLNLSNTKVSYPGNFELALFGSNLNPLDKSTFNGLAKLKNLEVLNLSGTKIENVTPLVNLTQLTTLFLSHTPVSDVSALVELINLKKVHLNHTKVKILSAFFMQLKLRWR